jgi:transposase InsO family protein
MRPPNPSFTVSLGGLSQTRTARALLTDNGAAMLAAETVEGLGRLGVVHHTTLPPYSPEQNGKQESFWGQIEGRLLPMLEGGARSPMQKAELTRLKTEMTKAGVLAYAKILGGTLEIDVRVVDASDESPPRA